MKKKIITIKKIVIQEVSNFYIFLYIFDYF